jgi:hypothetical protein
VAHLMVEVVVGVLVELVEIGKFRNLRERLKVEILGKFNFRPWETHLHPNPKLIFDALA